MMLGCNIPYKNYYKNIAIQQQNHSFILGNTPLDLEIKSISRDVFNRRFTIAGIIRSAGYERDGNIFRIKDGDTSFSTKIEEDGKFKITFTRNEILKIVSDTQLDLFIRYCVQCVKEEGLRKSYAFLHIAFTTGFNNDTVDFCINRKYIFKNEVLSNVKNAEYTSKKVWLYRYRGDCIAVKNDFEEQIAYPCLNGSIYLKLKVNGHIYEYDITETEGKYIVFDMVNHKLQIYQTNDSHYFY